MVSAPVAGRQNAVIQSRPSVTVERVALRRAAMDVMADFTLLAPRIVKRRPAQTAETSAFSHGARFASRPRIQWETWMKKFCALLFVTFAFALGSAGRADAAPIGTFAWDSCGPDFVQCFRVENFSDLFFPEGLTFADITLTFTTTSGALTDTSIGSLMAGESGNTLTDPFAGISVASLSFTVGLPGTLTLLDSETFQPIAGLESFQQFATIDFTQPDQTPVPEPGTLFLVTTGIVALGRQRFRERRPKRLD
jgi:hypothetical protein